jgi:hypothetical protein
MANFWVQVAGAIELDLSTYELANHDSSESRGLRHKDDTTRGSRDREPAQSSDRVALTLVRAVVTSVLRRTCLNIPQRESIMAAVCSRAGSR